MHSQAIAPALAIIQTPLVRALVLALALAPGAHAADDRFDIRQFEVKGNTLLPAPLTTDAVAPFAGPGRTYADVERAREALELKYREAGFGAVLVHVPEQELTQGLVRLEVIESRLKVISTTYVPADGSRHFSPDNVRASLPALAAGATPNTPAIAENIQLVNENPAKQVEVVLKAAAEPGDIDAEISVQAADPKKLFVTLDNTGSATTGEHRVGVGLQHANLFGRDHVGTLNYTTSPEKPEQVKLYSLSYRWPLYALGDSIDLIVAKSDVDAGTTQVASGPLTFTGRGDVYGLHYNYLLSRHGEYAHRLVFGLDYRAYDNTCSLGFGAGSCGASGVDVTVRPLSVTYSGQWAQPRQASDFSLAYTANWPGAKNGKDADFALARPASSGVGGAPAHYALVRASGSHLRSFDADWQLRLAASAQVALDPLISAEQFGLAGATSVRGFSEREAASDSGYVLNLEAYSPNLAPPLGFGSNLRLIAFYDTSSGRKRLLDGDAQQRISLASAGLGVRFGLDKSLQFKLDAAQVIDGDTLRPHGHTHGHFSIYYAF